MGIFVIYTDSLHSKLREFQNTSHARASHRIKPFPPKHKQYNQHPQPRTLPALTHPTMPSPSESLDIAELAIFSPLLLLTLIVIYRHGFHRQSGWIYLSIFCLIRIIGGALGIAAEKNPSNVSDLEWSAILGSIGISPLLLASLGLLKRM